jgi:hypothetical protein
VRRAGRAADRERWGKDEHDRNMGVVEDADPSSLGGGVSPAAGIHFFASGGAPHQGRVVPEGADTRHGQVKRATTRAEYNGLKRRIRRLRWQRLNTRDSIGTPSPFLEPQGEVSRLL